MCSCQHLRQCLDIQWSQIHTWSLHINPFIHPQWKWFTRYGKVARERGHKQASTRETPLLFGGKVGLLDATMCVHMARFKSSVPLSYLAMCILVLAPFIFLSWYYHTLFRLMHFVLFWSSRSMPMFLFPSSLGTQHISHIPLIFNNFF